MYQCGKNAIFHSLSHEKKISSWAHSNWSEAILALSGCCCCFCVSGIEKVFLCHWREENLLNHVWECRQILRLEHFRFNFIYGRSFPPSSSALLACSFSILSSAFWENKKYIYQTMLLWEGRWNGNKSQSWEHEKLWKFLSIATMMMMMRMLLV